MFQQRSTKHAQLHAKMRSSIVSLLVFATGYGAGACGVVPVDPSTGDSRGLPPVGAMRGNLQYEGPLPCSRRGHIEGSALILVYRAGSLPAPRGTASRPVNFTVVSGDSLFPNVPRFSGAGLSCPNESVRTLASAPFAISPLDAGSYVVTAFFSRSGNVLPSFGIRNQMERGDIYGGYTGPGTPVASADLGTVAPLLNVEIGEATGVIRDSSGALTLTIPASGFLAEGIQINLSRATEFGRPYFHVESESAPAQPGNPATTDANADTPAQIVMSQDHQLKAPPRVQTAASLKVYEDSFVGARLNAGVRSEEFSAAVDPREPLLFQLGRATPQTFSVFARGQTLPENEKFAAVWPLITFSKLTSATPRDRNLQSLNQQTAPAIFLTGITLADDSLSATLVDTFASNAASPKDHVRALVRPAVVCLPRGAIPGTGLLVAPHRTGLTSDATGATTAPLFDDAKLLASTFGLARSIRIACLPLGRYAITTVYPTGQSWTIPNEAGSCAALEGRPASMNNPSRCDLKERPVLASQGPRAVLEIVAPTTLEGRAFCEGAGRVPDECQ